MTSGCLFGCDGVISNGIPRAVPPRQRNRTDCVVATALFSILGGLAYASAAGITCSNDGSSYALTRALAEQHTVRIDSFVRFTEGIDLALHGGHSYSDRAPGIAFAAIPLDWIGRVAGPRPSIPRSKHDGGAAQIPFVLLLPAAAAGAASALVFLIARRLGAAAWPSLLAAVAAGAGSLLWKDGALFYRHDPAAALVGLAALLALGVADAGAGAAASARADLTRGAGAGLAIGAAAVCDPPAALALAGLVLYALLRLPPWAGPRERRRFGLLLGGGAAGLAPPALAQLLYNRACFGRLFANAYQYSATAHFYGAASSAFSTPFLHGARVLLLGAPPFGSLRALSPALLAGLAGVLVLAARRRLAELALLGGGTLAVLALVAKHATFDGGGDQDYRYLVCAIPLVAPLFALLVDAAWRGPRAARALGAGLAVALVGLSIARSATWIRLQYGHRALPGRPIFTNLANLPLWIAACGVTLLVGYGLRRPRRNSDSRKEDGVTDS